MIKVEIDDQDRVRYHCFCQASKIIPADMLWFKVSGGDLEWGLALATLSDRDTLGLKSVSAGTRYYSVDMAKFIHFFLKRI